MANPYLFIVGCARSGTTLLRRMVNAHPQLAILKSESHWIPRLFEERKGLTPDGWVTPELITHLLDEPKFLRLQIGREKLEELLGIKQQISYSNFVSLIFDAYGQSEGKSLVGDKTPAYVRKLLTLHELWPSARFVHLIRDGRDVCLSIADWPTAQVKKPGIFTTWKTDPLSTSAFWWDSNVRLGRQVGKLLGPKLYYEIRYESLMTNPRKECTALCDFLGLPNDDAMLQFHVGRTRSKPGLDAKHAWLPITPGLRNWKSQMPDQDVERFEAAAGELLDELDYPRAVPRPQPDALGHAAKMRDSLDQDPNWRKIILRCQAEVLERTPAIRDLREQLNTGDALGGRISA